MSDDAVPYKILYFIISENANEELGFQGPPIESIKTTSTEDVSTRVPEKIKNI